MSMNKLVGEVRDNIAALRGPGRIWIPPSAVVLASTGAPLAEFSDGASATPGLDVVDAETHAIRWNNHATPAAVMFKVFWDESLDVAYDATLKAQCSKTGATLGDATSLTATAFNQVTGSLHDADADFGGASSAITGDATAKTLAVLTRTLAKANLPATLPASTLFTVTPTAGLLGTDDFLIHMMWIEYTLQPIS